MRRRVSARISSALARWSGVPVGNHLDDSAHCLADDLLEVDRLDVVVLLDERRPDGGDLLGVPATYAVPSSVSRRRRGRARRRPRRGPRPGAAGSSGRPSRARAPRAVGPLGDLLDHLVAVDRLRRGCSTSRIAERTSPRRTADGGDRRPPGPPPKSAPNICRPRAGVRPSGRPHGPPRPRGRDRRGGRVLAPPRWRRVGSKSDVHIACPMSGPPCSGL